MAGSWKQEEINALKVLHWSGISYQQIADRLTAQFGRTFTHSMITTKINVLKQHNEL